MIVELIVLLASIFVFLQFVKGRGGESKSPTLEEAEQKLAKKELEKEKLVKKSTRKGGIFLAKNETESLLFSPRFKAAKNRQEKA